MLEKNGIRVSICKTHAGGGGQEFTVYQHPHEAENTPLQLIIVGQQQAFYPELTLTSNFDLRPSFNALHIQLQHNRDKHEVLLNLKDLKTPNEFHVDLGLSRVMYANRPNALSLRHVLHTGVIWILNWLIRCPIAEINRILIRGGANSNENAQAGFSSM